MRKRKSTYRVVRKYKLKSGRIVTKVYEEENKYDWSKYSKKARAKYKAKHARKLKDRQLLVSKNGRRMNKAIKAVEEQINANQEYSEAEKITLINDIKAQVKDAQTRGKSLTLRQAEAKITDSKVEKYLINLGYDSSELAEKLGVDEEDLLMPSNWKQNTLKIGEKEWRFSFNYDGDAYLEYVSK